MTESLADGPDWHLRSRFCSGFSLFSVVHMKEGIDFGQSRFGHPDLTNFGQSNFGQSIFGHRGFGQSQFWPKPILAKANFGQSNFGQSNFGQSNFGQSTLVIWCVCHGGAPKSVVPNPEKMGPEEMGPEVVGPRRVRSSKGGAPKGWVWWGRRGFTRQPESPNVLQKHNQNSTKRTNKRGRKE